LGGKSLKRAWSAEEIEKALKKQEKRKKQKDLRRVFRGNSETG
jgi:hypothetical protein